MTRILLVAFFCCYTVNSWALSGLREIEYAEEIESSVLIGKISWLKAKNNNFLALYTETEGADNIGTAILLHQMGGHPNQKKLIRPLRTYLPKHKWATLSLQMPVLGVGAKEDEYYLLFDVAKARIQAAIDYLIADKVENIVLIGHGLGGMMAIYYIKENSDKADVEAVVTISLSVPETEYKQAQVIDSISRINQPLLDIFAEFDSLEVTKSARQRKIAGKNNLAYRQLEIKGEGYLFQHDEGLVVKRVYSWINRMFR